MIKTIKTCVNGESFLFDKNTNTRIMKFDPYNENIQLVAKMEDGSILQVDNKEIELNYGGLITFNYKDDMYIIDDGYQNLLIRSGYIVMNDFDSKQIMHKQVGLEIRSEFINVVKSAIDKLFPGSLEINPDTVNITEQENQQIKITFEKDIFDFTVVIDTINNIVAKNQQRKINGLAFYPFEKCMDKYGTLFITIFAKVKDSYEIYNDNEDVLKNKYQISESILTILIDELNNMNVDIIGKINETETGISSKFRYQRIIVKKRINYWEGI